MNDVKLGQLLREGEASRDAIHIAIAPLVAAEALRPGQHIGIKDNQAVSLSPHIGIVDPFLTTGPQKGDTFYICLYPRSITSLRHDWMHPAFPQTLPSEQQRLSAKDFSEQWLKDYATRLNIYDKPDKAFLRLIEGLTRGYLAFHGRDIHNLFELPQHNELKTHAERFLGITIDWGQFTFSCSC